MNDDLHMIKSRNPGFWVNFFETKRGTVPGGVAHSTRASADAEIMSRLMHYPDHRCVYRIRVAFKPTGRLSPIWGTPTPDPVSKSYVDGMR